MGLGDLRNGKRDSWPHVEATVPWIKPIPQSPRHGVLNEVDEARTDHLMSIQPAVVEPAYSRETGPLYREINRLQEDLHIAQHKQYEAEVGKRRADQKRRNQKKQLRQLHVAINEKNNRIRNLESQFADYEKGTE